MTDDQSEREVAALIDLSQRSRAKLDRLHTVLTSGGHYGTGASPSTVVYRENKLSLRRLTDEQGSPFAGPPVLFIPAPVSRYFIIDLQPGTYTITYTLPGFVTVRREGVQLSGTQTLTLPIEMRVSPN